MGPNFRLIYQILAKDRGQASGGIFRRFLGLTPGHAYRIAIRVNTLQSDPAEPWQYAGFVTTNAGDRPPPPEVMTRAGEPGFDGGGYAIQPLFLYRGEHPPVAGGSPLPAVTTSGQWAERTTGEAPPGPGGGATDLVLAPGQSEITLWLRLSGTGAAAGVGMDWLSFTDLSLPAAP